MVGVPIDSYGAPEMMRAKTNMPLHLGATIIKSSRIRLNATNAHEQVSASSNVAPNTSQIPRTETRRWVRHDTHTYLGSSRKTANSLPLQRQLRNRPRIQPSFLQASGCFSDSALRSYQQHVSFYLVLPRSQIVPQAANYPNNA